MHDAFLSHNSADKPMVDAIAADLAQRGLVCWYDKEGLRGSHQWMPILERELQNSECCVLFYGPSGIGPWHEMERQLAQLMAMDAWRAGKHFGIIPVRLPGAPSWRELDLPPFLRLYAMVEFSEDRDAFALAQLAEAISQEAIPPELSDLKAGESPYVGMKPYLEADAGKYFGRNNYILQICSFLLKVHAPRFMAIIGSSGSGKSSLMNAGVLPRLRQGTIRSETNDWIYIELRTGGNAWGDLRATILGNPAFAGLASYSASRPDAWLHEITLAALSNRTRTARLMLFIDQFEELVTSRPPRGIASELRVMEYEEQNWRPFLENLAYAAKQVSGRVSIVITLRNDFLEELMGDTPISPLLNQTELRCPLGPLTEAEVRSVIERPAVSAKLTMDKALSERLVQDYLLDKSGALPFLQEALLRLSKNTGRNQLSYSDYLHSGGLLGALNTHAQDVMRQFPGPKNERLFRQVFVHLVRISDDGGPDTKRRRPLAELPGGSETQEFAKTLATEDYRMLVIDQEYGANSRSEAKRVEIGHESLIRGWKLLDTWLNDRVKRPLRIRLRHLEIRARPSPFGNAESPDRLFLTRNELRDAKSLCETLSEEVPQFVADYVSESEVAARRTLIQHGLLSLTAAVVVAGAGYMIWPRAVPVSPNIKLREQLKTSNSPAQIAVITGRILETEPHDSEIWAKRAEALLKDPEGFKNALEGWEKNVPGEVPEREFLLGEEDSESKKVSSAIEHWKKYRQLSANNPALLTKVLPKLAAAHAAANEWDGAIDAYDDWIKLADNPAARLGEVDAYRAARRWDEYETAVKAMREKYPDSEEVKRIKPLEGVDELRKLAEAADQDAYNEDAWYAYAAGLTQAQEFKAVVELCKRWFERNGSDSFVMKMEQAHAQWQLGEPISAELQVIPSPQWQIFGSQKFLNSCNIMDTNLRKYREASGRIASGVQDGMATHYYTRGEALAQLGQHALAISDFDQALKIDPMLANARKARDQSTADLHSFSTDTAPIPPLEK